MFTSKRLRLSTVIAVLLLVYFCSSQSKSAKPDKGLTISLCIPAIEADVLSGALEKCLNSIYRQSRRPDEVIIRISSLTMKAEQLMPELRRVTKEIPLKLLTTPLAQNPGINRNVAAREASGDIISFFDSDDEMHPYKLEIVHGLFQESPNLSILLHGLTFKKTWHWETMKRSSTRLVRKDALCSIAAKSAGTPWLDHSSMKYIITHGHVTVSRWAISKYSFGEERSGEDCEFVKSILRDVCNDIFRDAILVDEPLTLYSPRSSREP